MELDDTLPPPPPKHCACGASYAGTEWLKLPYVGVIDDGVDRLELRTCPCSSTIAIELEQVRVVEREAIRGAVTRTVERLRSVGLEP